MDNWREAAGVGIWSGEPDRVDWVDEASGLWCHMRRGPSGAWCGYVEVGMAHRWYGRHYDDIVASVHGGLTYSGESFDDLGGWWLGFDCAHYGDFVPGYDGKMRELKLDGGAIYRELAWVREECVHLAQQAKEAEVKGWLRAVWRGWNCVRWPVVRFKRLRWVRRIQRRFMIRKMERILARMDKIKAQVKGGKA